MRRSHRAASQRKRRAWRISTPHRPAIGKPPLYPDDPNIIAVASDAPLATRLPLLPLDRPEAIADFIMELPLSLRGPTAKSGRTEGPAA